MKKRKSGFYWVKQAKWTSSGNEYKRWEPAEWKSRSLMYPKGFWWLLGWDVEMHDTDLIEIGERISQYD